MTDWTLQNRTIPASTLLIDSTYQLLIDSTYQLLIETAGSGVPTDWTLQNKN